MSAVVPPTVASLCLNHGAWIVGSAARPDTDISKVRDFDLIVPFDCWHGATLAIAHDAVRNSLGGFKFRADEVEIDMWPGALDWMFRTTTLRHAWNPSLNIRLTRT